MPTIFTRKHFLTVCLRWPVLASLMLLSVQVRAQIAIHDGSPPTIADSGTGTNTVPVTVTAGASVLVVLVEDHGANVGSEPSTLSWNGATLSRAVQEDHTAVTMRGSAIYYLYNPPPASAVNLAVGVPTSGDTAVTWFTLSGVNTGVPPLIAGTNTGSGSAASLTVTVSGVTSGSWAVANSTYATENAVATITGTGGTAATAADETANATTTYTAGYIAGLGAGTDSLEVNWNNTGSNTANQKANFGAVIFTPATLGPTVTSATATPSGVTNNQTTVLQVTVMPGNDPTISSVTVNLSSIGGIANEALVYAGADVWTNTIRISAGAPVGAANLPVVATDAAGLSGTSLIALTVLTLSAPPASVPVLTFHYDNTRQGANTNETLLTPASLNVNTFGKLFTHAVDGYVYAQPLIMTNLTIPGQGAHNVVFVATENDTVYAFDADSNAGANGGLLWSNHLGTPVPYSDVGYKPDGDMSPSNIGITGTPVIDPATGSIYFDTGTYTNGNYTHLIHALNLTTGAEQPYSPVVVAAAYAGSTFNAQAHAARPALTLAGGIVYAGYGSYQDTGTYHGWLIGFNATNLAPLTNYVFNTSPNANQDALWMGGGGMVVDSGTNIYFEVANGTFDVNTGGKDYGQSFVKLATANGLSVADYFTPYNQASLSSSDTDIGSGAPMLLPPAAGNPAHPQLIVGAGKAGTIYLVDTANMGHYSTSGSDSQIVQYITGAVQGGGSYATPAYWNNRIYYTGKSDNVRAFGIANGLINGTPQAKSPTTLGPFTGSPVVSANGTNNGIVWVTDPGAYGSSGAAVLHAYNATNLAVELYNSSQNLSRDNPGGAVKMTAPVVANGKVYVGAEFSLSVFGYTTFAATPLISPSGEAYTNSVTVTLSDTTAGAAIHYTLDGTTPTSGSALYTGPFSLTTNALVQAIAIAPGTINSAVASASFINSAGAGSGTGLLGQYWANTTGNAFTNITFNALPTLTRTDAVVNFNWTTNEPAPGIGTTNFAVRWTGCVQPQFNETYTLRTVTDGGVRLWVNGQLLIDDWANQTATTNSGVITLRSQQLYNLRMDYFQNTGAAVAALAWSSPSTPQFIIPQSQLYPFTNPPPAVALVSPTNGAGYTAAASVTLGANADAPYNSISAISFYANGSWLGTVTNGDYAPLYALTATGLAAGSYALTAVATDGSGLTSTSAPVNITVNAGSGQPYGLTNNAPLGAFLNLNMPTTFNGVLPPLLSGTGAYPNLLKRVPAAGLIPYVPNVPLWSDGAVKSRYLALPNSGGSLTPDEQIQFAPTNTWAFPAGTVFVKNFDLVVNETNANVPLRRLETRLLVRDTNGAVYGVTYKWRPDNSDADLLLTSSNENILITNAAGVTTQTWYYPSPADCLTCHTRVAGYVLGVNTRQLNGVETYPAASTTNTDNQLRTLNRLGLLYPAMDEAGISNLESLSSLTNLSASLEQRSRSYLDANCAQCHQPGGTGITFDARYDTPLARQNITNYPAAVSLGYDGACIIKPEDIWRSMIWQRINTTNATTKMPPLARSLIDTNAVAVFADWINSLPGIPALAPPTISPNGGSFAAPVTITLQSTNNGATIYYTLDGSRPTTNSLPYSRAFNLATNATVSANAFEPSYNPSVTSGAIFYFTNNAGNDAILLVQAVNQGQSSSATFPGNQSPFQLGVTGVVMGSNYVLQATTNFSTWRPISTNLATTNALILSDPQATNFQYQFYRVVPQ